MSPGNDNQVDWTAASTPDGEARRPEPLAHRSRKPRVRPTTKRGVMDTLLGENNLSAFDAGGNDPYNATGGSSAADSRHMSTRRGPTAKLAAP